MVPPAQLCDLPETVELQLEAERKNLGIVSGESGRQVLRDVYKAFDFTSEFWKGMLAKHVDKERACLILIRMVGDAWHRLVFARSHPTDKIFTVCRAPTASHRMVTDVCEEILVRHRKFEGLC